MCVLVCGQSRYARCAGHCIRSSTLGPPERVRQVPTQKHKRNLIRRLELLDERAQGDETVLGSLALLCPPPPVTHFRASSHSQQRKPPIVPRHAHARLHTPSRMYLLAHSLDAGRKMREADLAGGLVDGLSAAS